MRKFVLMFILSAMTAGSVFAENIAEYFNAGNPIEFCGKKFYLAWSSRPYDFYMLQEYLPTGETFDRYNQMFTVSVMFYGDAPFNSRKAAEAKIAELEERAKNDPVCRYIMSENGEGGYIVDFIVSDGKGDRLDCVEADIHYYRDVEIEGRKASLLLFYSRRAYGDDIIPFMKSIPAQREDWYKGMSEMKIVPKFSFSR